MEEKTWAVRVTNIVCDGEDHDDLYSAIFFTKSTAIEACDLIAQGILFANDYIPGSVTYTAHAFQANTKEGE